MPSKKKNSRTPSKVSNSDAYGSDSPSPSYNISSSLSPLDPENRDLLSFLREASAKFPSFISESAFVGRVMDGNVSNSTGCKIWLSESAMTSSSISPGSLVSVSLASLDQVSNEFSLSALSSECARYFGFDPIESFLHEPGDFFALATVYPSSKVVKNGVHLSSTLSITLGCPDSRRTIFIYPLKCQHLTEHAHDKGFGLADNCFSSRRSEELYLLLVSMTGKFESGSAISSFDASKEASNSQMQSGKISSPMTSRIPLSQVSSPHSTQAEMSAYDKSVPMTNHMSHSLWAFDGEELLKNVSSRKLLEICTTSWLFSRVLLPGNFVTIPILSRQCIFRVLSSKTLSSIGQNPNEIKDSAAYSSRCVECIFSVDRGTKVHLQLSRDSTAEPIPASSLTNNEYEHGSIEQRTEANFQKLGGVSKEFDALKDIVISSAVNNTAISYGLRPTKGVLLHGPPGSGKTTLARLCAHDTGVNFFSINGPEIISQYHGESERALYELFERASQAVPALIFIDELDAVAPARKDGGDQFSQRMVATLLNLMDGMSRTDGLLVVAATNRPDSIEPALRRPGRLDREIEIGVPSPGQRHEILLALLGEMQHSLSFKDVQDLALTTHGFVGADLAALCNEAAMICLRRYINFSACCLEQNSKKTAVPCTSHRSIANEFSVCAGSCIDAYQTLADSVKCNLEASFSSEVENLSEYSDVIGSPKTCCQSNCLTVTSEDFDKAKGRVRPSAMREVILEVPKVSWEDVGGQKEIKTQLMEAVVWPQKHKDAFLRIGTRPPTGILLFGPPGCSKTLLARAVASEAGLNFLAVKGPELFSKWVGESEKAVRSLFAKARANAPSVIFFDEIDGLAMIRGKESDGVSVGDRVMSQLLVELDGLQERGSVTVIAATNRPDKIDAALLRPGRFDRLLFVGPPNEMDREDIFRVHLRQMPCNSDVCITELAHLTEDCTGADISLICREAAIAAIEENLCASDIKMKHFRDGIKKVEPSDVQVYKSLSLRFQRLVHANTTEDDSSGVHLMKGRAPVTFRSIFQLPSFLKQKNLADD